jgi:hypothetical protein
MTAKRKSKTTKPRPKIGDLTPKKNAKGSGDSIPPMKSSSQPLSIPPRGFIASSSENSNGG